MTIRLLPCKSVRFVRRHPLLTVFGVLGIAVLAIITATFVAVWQAAHIDDARRVDHADTILVLGAAEYDGRPSPVFQGRLKQAALLFNEKRAGSVIVLGGGRPGDVTTEAQAGRDYLLADGLPSDQVIAEPRGNTTYESLQAAATLMQGRGLRSAFLVSDPWHNLRIKKMAGDLGIRAYASATWHSAATSLPTRLSGYARETVAYLYYRIFGGH
jgi:uncharacterized SAM-binding protein YcdF (DUF218 family)